MFLFYFYANILCRKSKKIHKIVAKNKVYSQRNESLSQLRRLLNEAIGRADKLKKEITILQNDKNRETNRLG